MQRRRRAESGTKHRQKQKQKRIQSDAAARAKGRANTHPNMTSRLPRLYVGRHHQHQLRRRQAKEEGGEGKGGEGTKKTHLKDSANFAGLQKGGRGGVS